MFTTLLKNFIKIYVYDLIAFWLCAIVFVITSIFVLKSWYEYQYQNDLLEQIIQEEKRISKIEKIISLIDSRLEIPQNIDNFYIASISKTLNIYPFNELIDEIASIYDPPGFFFLESLDLNTCLDINLQKGNKCDASLKLKGRKIIFRNKKLK